MNLPYLFSVIIPTFNRAELCREAIESVLQQTFTSYELIIVDDGSTDHTSDMVGSFAGTGLQYIRQENRGVSSARNLGAKTAVGKYLSFLDSDDLWLPEKLEKQADFFHEHPDVLICQTGEIWIQNGKRIYPKDKHKKEAGDIFHRAVELCLVSPSAVSISRDLFLSVNGFDETLPAAEDYDLWLRLLWKYSIGLIDEPLVIKRAGNWDQLSFSTQAIDQYRILSLCNILKKGVLNPDQEKAAREALRKKSKVYIQGCRKRGKWDEVKWIESLLES
jgi:glycosyltransferase involved in cell wall biosynthesis